MKRDGHYATELAATVRALSWLAALTLLFAGALPAAAAAGAPAAASRAALEELLRDPTQEEWSGLSRFDLTLTRQEFEGRLDRVLDPGHGLRRYFDFVPGAVAIYPTAERNVGPVALVRFAADARAKRLLPVVFRPPGEARGGPAAPGRPLSGLRVAIEPADIGGRWAKMEDRSVEFPGYGRINEGDLNLVVGRLLRERLTSLGAVVFLVRDRAEPQLAPRPADLGAVASEVLSERPWLLPDSFQHLAGLLAPADPRRQHLAEGLLLTKTLETRARAALVRRLFNPDVTIVLQHNATPESTTGHLSPSNRNIFFVHGAYSPSELREPEQRFRLLTKLFEDTVRVETRVADAIAQRFKTATGYPPVLSGNSANTRLVLPRDPYVVARNLAFNREHDGPVVVTEPYFMNQAETLARLLAGDYAGERRVAGRFRVSIYREYADCVAEGLVDAYRPARPAVAMARPSVP